MTTGEAEALELDASLIGTLELETSQVPYVDLEDWPTIHTRVRVSGVEYGYDRSFPVKGHSAVMPAVVAELLGEGKRVLVVERGERYIIYLA